jgi:hypothetical protein
VWSSPAPLARPAVRVVDAWLALPAISFAIFLADLLGPSEMNIVIILACAPKPAWGLMLADGKEGMIKLDPQLRQL